MNSTLLVRATEATAGMDPVVQLVLIRIAALADKHGLYRGGQEKLAEDASCSLRAVKQVMKHLEAEGLVHREAFYRPSGRRGPDRVKLTIHKVQDVHVVRRRLGAQDAPVLGAGDARGLGARGAPPIEDTLKGGDRDKQLSRRAEDEGNDNAPPDGPESPGPRLTLHHGGKAA